MMLMRKYKRSLRLATWRLALPPLLVCGLAGCEAVALTALGVGASAGVNRTAEGMSTRTFTAPPQQVKAASLMALSKMGIALDAVEPSEAGERIRASSGDRRIEIELEATTRSTTQMRATAKRGWFGYDGATAREVVAQTEQAMVPAAAAPRRAKPKALAAAEHGSSAL